MSNSKFGCFGVFISLLLVVSLLLNLIFGIALQIKKPAHSASNTPSHEEQLMFGEDDAKDKIALIDLRGVISGEVPGQFGDTMVDDIAEQLTIALKDSAVKAILLRIDSPGGEVTASDIIYHEISKARVKKPVLVYMESVAASGGYYSAMGANYIMASDTTITGSIGVIMQTYNVQDLLGKIGVKALTFKSGKMKDVLSPVREVTPEEKAFIQALIDETYGKFVGIVARERRLDEAVLRENIADGRIFSGKQALNAKLIDGIGYFEDAVAKTRELGKSADAKVVRYLAPFDFERFLNTLVASPIGSVKVQVGPASLPLVSGKLYYLSPHLIGR